MARQIIKRSLEICGLPDVKMFEASNGIEALEILKTEKIDLVFTDLNMPEMDGEKLLIRIKSSPSLNEIPVVIVSSKSNPANEKKLITEHAVAVLAKPLSLPSMHELLSEKLSII
jgi:CheY-like chemotaxis protein